MLSMTLAQSTTCRIKWSRINRRQSHIKEPLGCMKPFSSLARVLVFLKPKSVLGSETLVERELGRARERGVLEEVSPIILGVIKRWFLGLLAPVRARSGPSGRLQGERVGGAGGRLGSPWERGRRPASPGSPPREFPSAAQVKLR